jgi:hypothetical protein
MPELSELKLTAEFINRIAAGKVFFEVEKNPDHKGKAIEINYPFTIEAKSRGKELMLTISSVTDHVEVKHLMMGMGYGRSF